MSLTVEDREHYVADCFNRLEARFKPTVGADDYRVSALLRALKPLQAKRILDLGCGKGRFARHLVDQGAQVYGLDLSLSMIESASGIVRIQGSARNLPFRDDAFDAVIAIEVFEHLIDVDEALDEARRVLRPGGTIAIIDKNFGSFNAQRWAVPGLVMKWVDELRGRWMYPFGGPVRERWFWPRAFKNRIARRFDRVGVEYLLRTEESSTPLFLRFPALRLMVLWTGTGSGGGRP